MDVGDDNADGIGGDLSTSIQHTSIVEPKRSSLRQKNTMRLTMIGAGAWGTALAKLASDNGSEVTLWDRDSGLLNSIAQSNENQRYLKGIELPSSWNFQSDLTIACQNADALVIAIPSNAFREVLKRVGDFAKPIVSVAKGIELESGLTMSGVLQSELPNAVPVVLSGPTIAHEIGREMPAASVVASVNEKAAHAIQKLFHQPTFRVYTAADVLGVELGGALKNVIAIAAGVGDGLGFGDNSKSALITRGLAEMRRIGKAAGAKPETFSGLSGLGDLALTCFSPLSRNRGFGEALGRGGNLPQLLADRRSVVEGINASRSAHRLAHRLKVEAPIVSEVYQMLHEGRHPRSALDSLLIREIKHED